MVAYFIKITNRSSIQVQLPGQAMDSPMAGYGTVALWIGLPTVPVTYLVYHAI